jgi:hypothetical protein
MHLELQKPLGTSRLSFNERNILFRAFGIAPGITARGSFPRPGSEIREEGKECRTEFRISF